MSHDLATDALLAMRLAPAAARRRSPASRHAQAAYTCLHQACAGLLIVLFAPLMLVVALCLLREDGGPVLFAHWRVGQYGQLFRCLKFRSMRRDADRVLDELLAADPAARAEWARNHKLRHDPRVLGVGRFLRATSLDELPQLFNVLRGEMHLVGPRPVVVEEVPRYGRHKSHYLSVHPGMTGLWQVSGRNNLTYEQRVALDVRYVEERCAWLDLRILLRTVVVLITRDGAC